MSRRYLVGLVGEGITASLTPSMHEAEAAALGLEYEYRTLDLLELGIPAESLATVLDRAEGEGYAALNVTHPCKQRVIDLIDDLDPAAERLRAVNLVVFDGGRRTGYNTDWVGYEDAVRSGLAGARLDRVVQVGCGGAGAATAYALLSLGAQTLVLADGDEHRARSLADLMRPTFPAQVIEVIATSDLPTALGRADGAVNATPQGMRQHPGVAFDVDLLPAEAWVSDVVYRPLETELVRTARERGRTVLDGGRMAVGQACASLRIITGLAPDQGRVARHFADLLRRESAALPGPADSDAPSGRV